MIIKADLHTHSNHSSDGRQSVEELIAAAKREGLQAVALTEHHRFHSVPKEMDGILFIPAYECATDMGHITGLFLEQPPKVHKLQKADEVIKEFHRCGGIAVWAHPYQSSVSPTLPQGIDAIETANARATHKHRGANLLACALAEEKNLPAVGGSDGHSAAEIGNAYTEITCEELSLPAMKEAILRGDCKGIFKKETSPFLMGLSQFVRRRRMGGFKNLIIGLLILLKYTLKGAFKCR